MFVFCPKVLFDKQSIPLKVGCPGMATTATPQHPTLSRRIQASTSVILHERPLGWGESKMMSDVRITITEKETKTRGTVIAECVLVFASGFLGVWTFSLLWGWFIVPIFGVPQISMFQSLGIMLTASLINGSSSGERSNCSDLEKYLRLFILITLTLVSGWFVHFFV